MGGPEGINCCLALRTAFRDFEAYRLVKVRPVVSPVADATAGTAGLVVDHDDGPLLFAARAGSAVTSTDQPEVEPTVDYLLVLRTVTNEPIQNGDHSNAPGDL